jgi:hypothetical protein
MLLKYSDILTAYKLKYSCRIWPHSSIFFRFLNDDPHVIDLSPAALECSATVPY